MSFIYLASPYTHPDPAVMEARYKAALHGMHFLMVNTGDTYYSPIVHYHPLAILHTLPRDIDFWEKHNFAMIEACREFHILRIDGWEQSKGISRERERAIYLKKPLKVV